jgi:6-phosphogluconolactonase
MRVRACRRSLLLAGLLVCGGTRCVAQNSKIFQYFYDNLGQLVKVVDSTGVVIQYVYDPAGNLLQINRSTLGSSTAVAIFNVLPQRGTAGTTVTIQGQGFDPTPANDTVKFNSTLAAVTSATVSQLVTTVPVGAKTGPVSVTVGGVTAQGDVFTVLPRLVSLAVTPANPSISAGRTVQITATGTFDDGTAQDLTTSVNWNSSDLGKARISNALGSQGLVQGIAAGSTTITASSGSVTGSTTLTVTSSVLASIGVSPATPSLALGSKLQFSATATFSDGSAQDLTNVVTWGSSDLTVATISNTPASAGLASALGIGSTSITATSGSVTGSTVLTVTAAPTAIPRFAYLGGLTDSIFIYSVDPVTGQLRANGNVSLGPFGGPSSMAAHPSGKFLYATNGSGNALFGGLSAFTIDSSTGGLTPIYSPQLFAGSADVVVMDPLGRFVYSTSQGYVEGFTIDALGALTPVPGSPFAAGSGQTSLSVDPTGKFLYVTNPGDCSSAGSIAAFRIDPTTGTLTALAGSPFATDICPASVTVHPSGQFLYAITFGAGGAIIPPGISGYAIDSAGVLTPIPGSPFGFTVSVPSPSPLAIDPSGKFAYTTDLSGITAAFAIDSTTGALTPIAGQPFAGLLNGISVAVDPSGQFVYIKERGGTVSICLLDRTTGAFTPVRTVRTNAQAQGATTGDIVFTQGKAPVTYTPKSVYVADSGDNDLSAYTVDALSGALSPITGSPFSAGSSPQSVAVDVRGKLAYLANKASNNISGYTIDQSTGAIIQMTGSAFPAGSSPAAVAIDPSDRFVYVANASSNDISIFNIDPASGNLAPVTSIPSPVVAGTTPVALAIDVNGRYLYVANQGSNNLSQYSIHFDSGAITNLSGSPFQAGTNPVSVAVDPFGRFIYVANKGSGNISGYLHPTFVGLVPVAGSPFGAGSNPVSVTVDPSGRFAFVANQGDNTISTYTIDQNSGALSPVAGSPFAAGTAPSSVSVDVSGKFVYVTNSGSNNVSVFAINSANGALTPVAGSPFASGSGPLSVITTGTIH